jgi:hypothetical protein
VILVIGHWSLVIGHWSLVIHSAIRIPNSAFKMARLSRFALPPLVVIAALLAYRLISAAITPASAGIALPRNEPLTIASRFNDPRVVTDEQLRAVLARVTPPVDPVTTNNFVHALRLWGEKSKFKNAGLPSGENLRDYFLDDATFRRWAGENAPPLFYRDAAGVQVRSFDERTTDRATSSYHAADLIATLAETGVPLNTPLRLREGETTVRELLETTLRQGHLDQLEYEWLAIAYARYVFPQRSWKNKYGEEIDVNDLVNELIGHPPGLGPCNGLHRLEALAVLYRADETEQVLRPQTKLKILHTLKRTSVLLAAAQTSDGYWTRQWPAGAAAAQPGEKNPASLHDKLLVTGHHLEWLALAPDEVQPPRETVIRAAQWLARTLVEMDQKDLIEAYGPYTHAARALCLWRSVECGDLSPLLEAPTDSQISQR